MGLDAMLARNVLNGDSWSNCSGLEKHPVLSDDRKSQIQRPCLPSECQD